MKKTNAMRLLDANHIEYDWMEYDPKKGISGVEVAAQLDEEVEQVFKTLVVQSEKDYFVFLVPAAEELDVKKAAKIIGVKKVEMLPQRKLLPLTGYVHGGCSPLAMRKQFPTYIHESGEDMEFFYISGGKIGLQIKMNPKDLKELLQGKFEDIIKGE
ncbi:MAG: Cys-tRNA(Pro) deacylase [Tissierellia bacterium]|nr:Cys-tRNA(Pro) deacylase [Tissierellia bacterium]